MFGVLSHAYTNDFEYVGSDMVARYHDCQSSWKGGTTLRVSNSEKTKKAPESGAYGVGEWAASEGKTLSNLKMLKRHNYPLVFKPMVTPTGTRLPWQGIDLTSVFL